MAISNWLTKLRQKSTPVAEITSLATTSSIIMGNSLLCGLPLYSMGLIKSLTGSQIADKVVLKTANHWIKTNNYLINHMLPTIDFRLSIPEDLSETGKYILISNHQSWVDTTLTQYISEKRLPLTRFFTKHELLYIPIVGQSFYFLDFPMMKRYSKEAIAKNPKLRNRDIVEAKRACHLLMNKPFALLNYVEGTRFTPKKHTLQQSPYQHLLKPKAGGIALALSALGEQIDEILDMTIVYPDGIPTYGDLWKGNIKRIGVDVRKVMIPNDLLQRLIAGRYQDDKQTKDEIYQWLDELWQEKDSLMQKMLADFMDDDNSTKLT